MKILNIRELPDDIRSAIISELRSSKEIVVSDGVNLIGRLVLPFTMSLTEYWDLLTAYDWKKPGQNTSEFLYLALIHATLGMPYLEMFSAFNEHHSFLTDGSHIPLPERPNDGRLN